MENNKRPTQVKLTLDYLKKYGSITSMEGQYELGISSFPKRICEIEKMGFLIKKKTETVTNRYGKRVTVKRYSLIEEPKEESDANC